MSRVISVKKVAGFSPRSLSGAHLSLRKWMESSQAAERFTLQMRFVARGAA